jgi:hypothetical protein
MQIHTDTQITLTLYPFSPTDSPVHGTGDTLADALEACAIQAGRSVFLGHLELLCFDTPSFLTQLHPCMETYRLSPSCKLLYLKQETLPETYDTTQLLAQMEQAEETGNLPVTDLFAIWLACADNPDAVLVPVWQDAHFSTCTMGETAS